MTRVQQLWVAALSAVATIVVLTGGVGASNKHAVDLVAQQKPIVVTAALPSAPAPATETVDAGADDTGSAAAAPTEEVAPADVASEAPVDTGTTADDATDDTPVQPPATDEPEPSKIKHVFVISLAGRGFDAAFGPSSTAPYLANELRPKGALLTNYRSLGRADLPDLIAMIGGQPPNDDTRAACPTYTDIPPTSTPSKSGEITATGCVFPNTVTTIADQLSASRRSWRAYAEDLEKGPLAKQTCRRPDSNALDDTVKARPGDGYATRHNPFVYFHSLLDLGDCDADDGSLTELDADLASAKDTPNLSFIAPNLCNDGTESPCVDGTPGGLPAADAFLATWAPKILASPAYKEDGLLIVTFAGNLAPEPAGDEPAVNGALLVSPFAQAGSTVGAEYDPYSILRSLQDLFALKPLAHAATASSFADTVLTKALTTPPSDD